MKKEGPTDLLEAGLEVGQRETETVENQALPLHLGKTRAGKEKKISGSRSVLENPSSFLSTMTTDNRNRVILWKYTPSAAQALCVALGGGAFGIRETWVQTSSPPSPRCVALNKTPNFSVLIVLVLVEEMSNKHTNKPV